jgi:hypothetical protein
MRKVILTFSNMARKTRFFGVKMRRENKYHAKMPVKARFLKSAAGLGTEKAI